ncbi:hypothetical protein LCGC14_2046500, partial [marine sediment metagenome]
VRIGRLGQRFAPVLGPHSQGGFPLLGVLLKPLGGVGEVGKRASMTSTCA